MKRKRRLAINILAQYCDKLNIDIPDTIDTNDEQALKDYVDDVWVDIPLPEMEYVPYSDVPDWDGEWSIEEN